MLEEVSVDLSAYKIVLINPGIHINTGWAFAKQSDGSKPSDRFQGSDGLKPSDPITQPIETWKADLKNDFEAPVFAAHPQIKTIKEDLYSRGAIYASMSGSGSTVFGIFDQNTNTNMPENNNYFIKIIK